jgi:hypothetical protein
MGEEVFLGHLGQEEEVEEFIYLNYYSEFLIDSILDLYEHFLYFLLLLVLGYY